MVRGLRPWRRQQLEALFALRVSDVKDLATVVDATVLANHVWLLCLTAIRTGAAAGGRKGPIRRATAAALSFRGLLLWNGHSSSCSLSILNATTDVSRFLGRAIFQHVERCPPMVMDLEIAL